MRPGARRGYGAELTPGVKAVLVACDHRLDGRRRYVEVGQHNLADRARRVAAASATSGKRGR